MPARLPHRGVVLVLVLIVIVLLALAAYTFTDVMITHRRGAQWSARHLQARLLAESGVACLQSFLAVDVEQRELAGGIYHNPQHFGARLVTDRPETPTTGGFSIVTARGVEHRWQGDLRFGLENESGRLNPNMLCYANVSQSDEGQAILMGLPGMTEEIADAILDWLDADDEVRPNGAETEYYSSLARPYAAKNGPLDSVEELLLVKGVTPELLFGRDRNQNQLADPHESPDAVDGSVLDIGWSAFLTIYSMEHAQPAKFEDRVYVNQEDMQKLYDELLEAFHGNRTWAQFIVAYRQNGPTDVPAFMESTRRELDLTAPAEFPIRHLLDLVGQNVEVTMQGDTQPIVLASPFPADGVVDLLPLLDAALTVYDRPLITGRINIQQAGPEVLRTIPGMDDVLLEQIMAQRSSPAAQQDDLWLLTEGLMTIDQLRQAAPYIVNRGETFRAQIVGCLSDGSAFCRLEVVIDTGGGKPRLLMCRDLSHLGRGFSLSQLGFGDRPHE